MGTVTDTSGAVIPGARVAVSNPERGFVRELESNSVGEYSTLQFRWETINTFNHPQWKSINAGCSGAPNNDGTAAWGRPCGGNTYNLGIGEVSGAWAPRIMQFSLKFLF